MPKTNQHITAMSRTYHRHRTELTATRWPGPRAPVDESAVQVARARVDDRLEALPGNADQAVHVRLGS